MRNVQRQSRLDTDLELKTTQVRSVDVYIRIRKQSTYQVIVRIRRSFGSIVRVELPIRAGAYGRQISADIQCGVLTNRWNLCRTLQIDTGC